MKKYIHKYILTFENKYISIQFYSKNWLITTSLSVDLYVHWISRTEFINIKQPLTQIFVFNL